MFPTAHGITSQTSSGGGGHGVNLGAPSVYDAPFAPPRDWDATGLFSNVQWGYRFTVGENDITIAALRLYNDPALTAEEIRTETVTVWQVSTEQLIASAIVSAGDGWGETNITPVTLLAGVEYAITQYAGGATRQVLRSGVGNNLGQAKVDGGITLGTNLGHTGAGYPSNTVGGTPRVSVAYRSFAPESGYRFLRLNILENNGNTTIRVMNIEYRDAIDGAQRANTTRPSFATNERTTAPWVNVFSGSTDYWLTESAVVTGMGYHDFGSGNEIVLAQYTMQAHTNSGARTALPNHWRVEGSNDLETWDVIDERSEETDWATSETRTFTL